MFTANHLRSSVSMLCFNSIVALAVFLFLMVRKIMMVNMTVTISGKMVLTTFMMMEM